MYYPSSENKGADQLCGYCEADLRLVFAYAKFDFSQRGYYNINIKFTNLLLISLCHKEILLVESRAQYDSPINNNFHMHMTFLNCG